VQVFNSSHFYLEQVSDDKVNKKLKYKINNLLIEKQYKNFKF